MRRWNPAWLFAIVALLPPVGLVPRAAAQGCGEWQWGNPLPQGNTLYSVAYGGGRYVAAGLAGVVMTSADGAAWTVRTFGAETSMDGVAWTGDRWVAVGGRTALTSPDGVTWTARALPSPVLSLKTVAGNGAVVVAADAFGHIFSSADGATWSYRGEYRNGYGLDDVAWGSGQFVAVGGGGALFTSPDGITWSGRTSGVTAALSGVVRGRDVWVAVGGTTVLTSPDAIVWTARTPPIALGEVTWTGSEFVAVGATRVATSPDGVTWTQRTPGTAYGLSDVASGPAGLVAVGTSGTVLTSTDAVTWTSHTAGQQYLATVMRGVAWNGSKLLAVGDGGTVLASADGLTWTATASGVTANLYAAAWDGQQFLVTGPVGQVLSSPDGLSWSAHDLPVAKVLVAAAWNGEQYVAVGGGGTLLTSPDGATWTQQASGATGSLLDVLWDGSRWVVVGEGGVVLTSPDGLAWASHPTGYGNTLHGIAFSGSRYVAAAYSGVIFHSTDAATWQYVLAGSRNLNAVVWRGHEFVAVGDWGETLTSPDGVSWSRRPAATTQKLWGLLWNGARTVAVGEKGTILATDCTRPDLQIHAVAPASGPVSGGTRAVLTGLGFAAGARVFFGGAEASAPVVQSGTSMAVTTPAHHKGVVEVEVRAPSGARATRTNAFAYLDQVGPQPTVALTPASLTVFPGATGTLTLAIAPAPAADLPVALASGDTALVQVAQTVTVPAGRTSVDVVATGIAPGGPVAVTATLPAAAGGGSASAQVLVRARALLAAAAHAPGLSGSQWRTDVSVVNDTGGEVAGEAVLIWSGAPVTRPFTLPAAGTVTWNDVLVGLFGFDAGASVKGTLRLDSDRPLRWVARTYNQQADGGTFGQYMPVVASGEGLATGVVGWLPQLRRSERFRTNIGVLNLGAASAAVRVRLFAAAGAQVGERIFTAGGYQTVQETDVFRLAGAGDHEVAFGTVEVTTPGARAWAWASVVDNATNDPTTVPVMLSGRPGPYFVAAAAHAPGLAGSQWRTDVAGVNPDTKELGLSVAWQPPTGSPLWQAWDLEGGAAAEWQDILVSMFGADPAGSSKGTVVITSSQALLLSARTYNQRTATETFGQFMPAVTEAEALAAGVRGVIVGLRKSARFRSNLGLVNLGNSTCAVRVRLVGPVGEALAETTLNVGAWQTAQVTDIFTATGAGAREAAYAVLEPLTSGGLVWGWVSVVDMTTNDPTTMPVLLP